MNFKSAHEQVANTASISYTGALSAVPVVARRLTDLTPRELEMLGYLAAGYSSEQIGICLYISKQTVDSHRKNIIKKMNMPNVTAAVAHALRTGLIV